MKKNDVLKSIPIVYRRRVTINFILNNIWAIQLMPFKMKYVTPILTCNYSKSLKQLYINNIGMYKFHKLVMFPVGQIADCYLRVFSVNQPIKFRLAN